MSSRLSLAALVVAVAVSHSWGAVLFDENYTGSNYQPLTPTGVIDMGEGNFVYRDTATALSTVGSVINWQFQTKVDGIIFDTGNIGFTFPGELTFIASVNQVVTNVTGNEITLGLGVPPVPNGFLNLWALIYDPTPPLGNSDINSGQFFNDGTVIMQGYFTSLSHVFDPTNVLTQPGEFLADLAFFYADPLAFQFTTPARATIDGASWFPSQLPASAFIVQAPPGVNDVTGSVDFSMQFIAIPEASTMMLVGIGLVAGGLVSVRRRQTN